MKFYHGTNSIALLQIIEDGFIQPLEKTNKQNLCCCTTTMQTDVIYLTTESFIANFYTPKRKRIVDDQPAYSCILEIELPFDSKLFRPDEDYMNDILSYTEYKLYDKYVSEDDYEQYTEQYLRLFKDATKKDIDFRYLFSKNKELGLTILSESDSKLSLELGSVAFIGKIPISSIKAVMIADIFDTKIYNLTKEDVQKAINKVDMSIDCDMFDEICM